MKMPSFRSPHWQVLASTLALFSASALACIWDRDTIGTEARGLPDQVAVITGRFERQPAQYYRMRLERTTKAIAGAPGVLENYDDAAVAAERLHLSDLAIEWMARKKAVLDSLTPSAHVKDHLYRYHANLGTFLAHKWIRGGRLPQRRGDIESARQHIAKAIEINPEAHFGRERYQLMAIEWLLAPAGLFYPARGADPVMEINFRRPQGARIERDAVRGLTGLIVLGDAWESVDIFLALGMALESQGHAGLALLVRLRVEELASEGKRSLNQNNRSQSLLMQAAKSLGTTHADTKPTIAYYAEARRLAKEWEANRLAYMQQRMERGEHPDTHKEFWNDYKDRPPAPRMPGEEPSLFWQIALAVALGGTAAFVFLRGIWISATREWTQPLVRVTANLGDPASRTLGAGGAFLAGVGQTIIGLGRLLLLLAFAVTIIVIKLSVFGKYWIAGILLGALWLLMELIGSIIFNTVHRT